MEIKSNLIGAVVLTSNMKSNFDHYDEDEDDVEVQGIIIERIDDGSSTIYLVMGEDGKVYQTDYSEIDKVISFRTGLPLGDYIKKKNSLLS